MKRKLFAIIAFLLVAMHAHADESVDQDQRGGDMASDEYKLQRNDSIAMTMFQEEGMSRSALIGKSGSISFTLIGSVDVVGLTVPQLEQKLTELYKKDYFVDPKISVIITGYAAKNVIVSGAVVNPGGVPYPDEGTISLAQAIAASGGITEMGDTNRITIVRKKGGDPIVTTMNRAGTVELSPGDTALVHMLPLGDQVAKTATIAGEVNRGGEIQLPASGKIDILSAIAKAGGLSRVANKKEATLRRLTPQGYTVENINMKDVQSGKVPMVFIREGDILMIKESIF
ncbi:MAG: polysaccharide biosynthesis/export family protein [Akkermansiaceae bacterium]